MDRKAFNFYKSYYDVFDNLQKDKDKLAFVKAIFEKQFKNIDPIDLKGQALFAYISQKHSIEAQVSGFITKTSAPPCIAPPVRPSGQEKGEEKVQEKEKVKEKVEVKEEEENKNYIECDFVKITDPMPILEIYSAALNGTQKENSNKAWRPLVEPWFLEHLGEAFNNNLHVKNSFKKYYISKLGFTPKQTRQPTFNLMKI